MRDSKEKLLVIKLKKIERVINIDNPSEEDIYDAVLCSVFILEHIIKKKLFDKNKLLIYDIKISENLDLSKAILEGKIVDKETIKIRDAYSRYIKFFPDAQIAKHEPSVEILIKVKNRITHDIDIKELQEKEILVGILEDVFPALFNEAQEVVGIISSLKLKKRKTYSEEDIRKIYENIVLEKLKNYFSPYPGLLTVSHPSPSILAFANSGNEKCPRCSHFTLSKGQNYMKYSTGSVLGVSETDLWSCGSCHLELTNLEYEAAKKLIKEGKV